MQDGPETMRFGGADHLVRYSQPTDQVSVATVAYKRCPEGNAFAITEGVKGAILCSDSGIGATKSEAFDSLAGKIHELLEENRMHYRNPESGSDNVGRYFDRK